MCLAFTMESGEDFYGWLPTLDLSVKVAEDNQIIYKFFEKPTASKVCLQADKTLDHQGEFDVRTILQWEKYLYIQLCMSVSHQLTTCLRISHISVTY